MVVPTATQFDPIPIFRWKALHQAGENSFRLCVALGTFVLFRGHSFWRIASGLYFISLGINYVPLLVYAVAITREQNARAELGDELSDERRAMTKYRRQSILLLVPLLLPILALARERRRAQAAQTGA